jgi:tetratricopeptide (TPR) repeat protein
MIRRIDRTSATLRVAARPGKAGAIAIGIALATCAGSGDAGADAHADAQAHVDHATTLFHDKQYRAALDELNTAYTLDPQPRLLYAIGQVHVQLGECDQAATFYDRFLASKPDTGVAAAAHEAIAACKAGAESAGSGSAGSGATGSGGSAAAPAEPPPPTWYGDHLADGLVIGGAISLVLSVGLYADARGQASSAGDQPTYQQAQAEYSHARSNVGAAILFGIAGAALVGGGVYHFLQHRPDRSVTVAPTAGGVAVSWGGRF